MTDFRLWTEGEDQVIGFVIQGSKMTDYIGSVIRQSGNGKCPAF